MSKVNDVNSGEGKYRDGFVRAPIRLGKEALKLLYWLNTDEITLDKFVDSLAALNATDMSAKY